MGWLGENLFGGRRLRDGREARFDGATECCGSASSSPLEEFASSVYKHSKELLSSLHILMFIMSN